MRARGFTLIELVITLAIIGLLATAALPLAQLTARREKEADLRTALRDIRAGIDAYKAAADTGHIQKQADASGYPPDLRSLYVGVADAMSPDHRMQYFMRRIPRDPFFPDGTAPAEDTWGLRSYASSPDDPQPGDDVYDIHSLSSEKALSGATYREW